MTLNRLLIILLVLMALAGGGIVWLWQYAYTPQGRARTILTQLRGETTGLRGWMIQHGVIKPEIEIKVLSIGGVEPVMNYLYESGPKSSLKFGDILDMATIPKTLERPAEKWSQIGPEAFPSMIEGLGDHDAQVRVAAAMACGQVRDTRAIGPLVQSLGESAEGAVRVCCVKSLAQIGGEQALEQIIAMGGDALEMGDFQLEINYVGREQANAQMIESRVNVNPISLTEEIARSFNDPADVPICIRGLQKGNKHVRILCVRILGKIGDARAAQALKAAANDSDKAVSSAAANALKKIHANPPATQPGR